jgi:hypothetical protein
MVKREPIELPCILRFPALAPYLGTGWNEVEISGTWACDHEAEVRIPLGEAAAAPFLLKLSANHCLPPNGSVTIAIETETGTSLLSFDGRGPDVEKELIIWESDVDERNVVKLVFNSPSVYVPYDIDNSIHDRRKLSVLLRSIALAPWPRLSVGDRLGLDDGLGSIVGRNWRRDGDGRCRNTRELASVKLSFQRDTAFPINVVFDFTGPDGAHAPVRVEFWNFARTLGSVDVDLAGDVSKALLLSASDLDDEVSTEIFCRILSRGAADGGEDAVATLVLNGLRIFPGSATGPWPEAESLPARLRDDGGDDVLEGVAPSDEKGA